MIRSEERTINGVAYTATTLPTRKAIDVGTQLIVYLGPAFGALGGSMKLAGGEDATINPEVIPQAVEALVSQMDKGGVVDLILEILQSTTRVDPETNKRQEVSSIPVFDTIYAANFAELLGALRFALEVSVGDFFGESGISSLIDRAKAAADRVLAGSRSGAK